MNLSGSIDLLKLEKSAIVSVNGKKCVIIPITENDIYVGMDENLKPKSAYIGLNINERREVSQFGKTHYCKQSFSKEYREGYFLDYEKKKGVYLGDFKEVEFKSGNQAASVEVPSVQVNDDLPF